MWCRWQHVASWLTDHLRFVLPKAFFRFLFFLEAPLLAFGQLSTLCGWTLMFEGHMIKRLTVLTVCTPISDLAILAAIKDLPASTAGLGFDLSSAARTQVSNFGVVKLNQKQVKLGHFFGANRTSKA